MSSSPPRVSVIIPIYNAEHYLRACLDTICRQTLRHIEIICVDDGSTDATPTILKEYSDNDHRIRLLHQQNLFAGAARQLGMESASGEYLAFVDSDDFFEPTMLEELVAKADKEAAEIVLCGADCYREHKHKYKHAPWMLRSDLLPEPLALPFCPAETIPEHLFNFVVLTPWAKLFRASFVREHQLTWSREKHANDILFVGSALTLAKKVSLIPKALVHYRVRSDSSANSRDKDMTIHYRAFRELHEKLIRLRVSSRVLQGFKEHLIKAVVGHWTALSPKSAKELRELARTSYEPTFRLLDNDITAYNQQSAYSLYRAIVRPQISFIFREQDIPASALHELLTDTTERPSLAAEIILMDSATLPAITRMFDSFSDLRFRRIQTSSSHNIFSADLCRSLCQSSSICHLKGAVTSLPEISTALLAPDTQSGFTSVPGIVDPHWHDSLLYLRAGGVRQIRLYHLPLVTLITRPRHCRLSIFGLPLFERKQVEKMNQIRHSYRILWLPLWQTRTRPDSIEYYLLGLRLTTKRIR